MAKSVSRKGRQEQANFMHVDDLGGLEVLQATYRRQTFSRHSHEGFCVGVIDEGAQRFYRTGGEHVAPLGSVILVNSDDIHTGSSASEDGWSYQIQARLRKGRQMLKVGSGVLETALACGFHDQSYFHRHFRKSIGVTPGDYVNSLR